MSNQCALHDVCFSEIKEDLLDSKKNINILVDKVDEWTRNIAVQQTIIQQLYDKVSVLEEKIDRQNQEFIKLDKKVAVMSGLISFITTIIILLFQKKMGL